MENAKKKMWQRTIIMQEEAETEERILKNGRPLECLTPTSMISSLTAHNRTSGFSDLQQEFTPRNSS